MRVKTMLGANWKGAENISAYYRKSFTLTAYNSEMSDNRL